MKTPIFLFLLFAIHLSVAADSPAATATRPPNVLFILADDLGWMDTSVYGSKYYKTPHLERLASSGRLFTNAYSANPLCSPTRASIMTGLDPARIGMTAPTGHVPEVRLKAEIGAKAAPSSRILPVNSVTRLDTSYYTLAEALHDAGYATGHFGKWHLGPEPYDPLHQGFDVDIPHWFGAGPAGSYVAPWKFPPKLGFQPRTPGEHIEDRMGDEAVAFMEKQVKAGKPFFINYWQFSVHAPHDTKADVRAKYEKTADPSDPQHCPTYAAMVEILDANVGKMLDALDRLGVADNTIVVFSSDNGGVTYEEVDGAPITSNLPLRGNKATIYEGGVRVPCIVRWPGVTAPGSKSSSVVQSTDWYPTLMEMLDVSNTGKVAFDGRSIVPELKGEETPDRPIFIHFPHDPPKANGEAATSVRLGDDKLIRFYFGGEDGKDRYELYDLSKDIGEKNNLASALPDKVRELDALITDYLQRTGAVVPKANPAYNPAASPRKKADAAPEKKENGPTSDRENTSPAPRPDIVAPAPGPVTDEEKASPNSLGLHFRGYSATTGDGTLILEGKGEKSEYLVLLLNPEKADMGPLVLEMTLATPEPVEGFAWWRTESQSDFPAGRQKEVFSTAGGQGFQKLEIALPIPKEELGRHLRIHFGTARRIEIQSIQIRISPGGSVIKKFPTKKGWGI